MIRFYKSIAKIVRTLKSYLTGAVLKMRYGFSLIICIMLNWRRLFVSFKKQKALSKKHGKGKIIPQGFARSLYISAEEFPIYEFRVLGSTLPE
jgi:hypothetical protein